MWTMVWHFLQVSDLIIRISRIRTLMHPRYLPRRPWIDLKGTLTLIGSMIMLVQDLPWTNTLMNPTNLGRHLPNTKNMLTRVNINLGPDVYHLPQRKISPLWLYTGLLSPLGPTLIKTNLNMIQTPPYYREVVLADIPSQYAEEVDTFRRILSFPDARESMPRSSTSVMGLDDEKGRQELRPRAPSSMLPLSSVTKDAFDKFEHDFKAANLPKGKYIKPPPSTTKWYKVGQPCYEEKMQELNTVFSKICNTPKPSGAPMGKVPLPILKELEHQARQNISTPNYTAAFAKTSSSCNVTLEKCQHSLKSTFKKVKSQIQKGANPEKAAKRGYQEACEYLDLWNKTILIQHRALTCLSKSLAHLLQRELYSMGNTGLLRREAEMTLLHPHLVETRRQELRNSPFWHSSLLQSQLVKGGEDFLLKKGTSKDSGFRTLSK